jgi:methionyl-tRNA synthetase
MAERFYVTTPIYYVNDKPHIGHAYCTVLADAAARWQRLLGAGTYFVTGTDEHGQKVQEAAAKRGIDPQAHCDELHQAFKLLWPQLHCAPDQFIRTTEPRHKAVVQRALQRLYDRGLIVARTFEGWYCVPDERFWTEKELVDGNCPGCGRAVVRLAEKNWFFSMSRYQARLQAALRSGRIEIVPHNRVNEVLGFLDNPLQDLCISRPKSRLTWGIELPFDPDFVTYVWFDALLNYATAIGFLEAEPPIEGSWPHAETAVFDTWWPDVTHLLGKDILTTHAVYWPTMMMGLAEAFDLPDPDAWLPRRLVVTGWWLMGDAKMSKSLGNVVNPLDLRDVYGPEVLRYFLLREMAVGQDANFSEEALLRRNNHDLANDLGNLLQRVTALAGKYWQGQVPRGDPQYRSTAMATVLAVVHKLLGQPLPEGWRAFAAVEPVMVAEGHVEAVAETVGQFRLHKALADAMALVGALNGLISHDKPFVLVKTDADQAGAVVYAVLEGLRIAAHLLEPALPQTAREILRRIGWERDLLPLSRLVWGQLQPGMVLVDGPALFPKRELPAPPPPAGPVAAVAPTQPEGPESAVVHAKELVEFDAFVKMDLRIGHVVDCEAVPKSKKLLKLSVDLGEPSPRQILSGIAASFAPSDLIGQRVLVLANLAPRKIMDHLSHGMVLVSEDDAGRHVLVQPAVAVPPGKQVR